jgi:hypothetical protein
MQSVESQPTFRSNTSLPPSGSKNMLCIATCLTLMLEATCSSETSVDFQRTTRRYIPEDRTLHKPRCKNLRCYNELTSPQQSLSSSSSSSSSSLLSSRGENHNLNSQRYCGHKKPSDPAVMLKCDLLVFYFCLFQSRGHDPRLHQF